MLRIYSLTVLVVFAIFLKKSLCRVNSVPMSKFATCREYLTDARGCQHYFPIESFKNYHSEKYNLYLKLYAFSYHDANIFLSNNKSNKDCSITIGGWSNTLSTLDCNGQRLYKSDIKDITSPIWPISIIIRQTTSGLLQVSVPGVAEPLLTGNATTPKLNYICLSSWGQTNRWFYNCTEDEDDDYEINVK